MITKYPVTPTLVLSQRYTADSIQMWRTAMRRGWDSVRASVGYARQLSVSCPLVYHESGPQVAEALGVTLISPRPTGCHRYHSSTPCETFVSVRHPSPEPMAGQFSSSRLPKRASRLVCTTQVSFRDG